MPAPSFAASRRVNPPGATPLLTEEQVWKGLGIKARDPKTFVPIITSCEVLSDDGTNIVRSVRFNNGEPTREDITLYPNTIAYFEMEGGKRITNLLSYNEEDELMLTFSFANGIPPTGVTENKNWKELNGIIGKGVEHSIERIRQLARDGVV
ncbi:hypothetical protein H0H93_001159 [Arthromyces matolae]|nr:hypothetical protein H0H93_001159 [Arthromyces matolae]